MKYLLTNTEVYRINSEKEATEFVEETKKGKGYILTKSTIEYKEKKQKGEVIDFWWKVTIVKKFDEEKDISVTNEQESAF